MCVYVCLCVCVCGKILQRLLHFGCLRMIHFYQYTSITYSGTKLHALMSLIVFIKLLSSHPQAINSSLSCLLPSSYCGLACTHTLSLTHTRTRKHKLTQKSQKHAPIVPLCMHRRVRACGNVTEQVGSFFSNTRE